jgi:hypothetical protein
MGRNLVGDLPSNRRRKNQAVATTFILRTPKAEKKIAL